jgi:hypothetical protein
MNNIQFQAVGKKDYMGFQWFYVVVNGVKGNKYKALDAQHALAIYNQLNKIGG